MSKEINIPKGVAGARGSHSAERPHRRKVQEPSSVQDAPRQQPSLPAPSEPPQVPIESAADQESASSEQSAGSFKDRLAANQAATKQESRKKALKKLKIGLIAVAAIAVVVVFSVFVVKPFFHDVTSEGISDIIKGQSHDVSDLTGDDTGETGTVSVDRKYPYFDTSEIAWTNRYEFVVQGAINSEDEKIKQLHELLDNYQNGVDIGLVIWSTDGDRAISYNCSTGFFSACTIKIPFCYWVCHQIEAGNGSLDEVMVYEPCYWHDGSGTIRHGDYYTEWTISELIELATSISDNVAYEMLMARFGVDGYNQWITSIGLNSLVIEQKWGQAETAHDQAAIWQMMYEYFQTDSACAAVLKKATYDSEYAYGAWTLTEKFGYHFNHKSGFCLAPATYNDCGIVWTDTPYVYVVLTDSGENGDGDKMDEIMELVCSIMQ